MDQNELNQKFMVFEQQIRQIQEQLQLVEQAIFEIGNIKTGLNELVGKVDEEILAPIGKGIYAKTKLLSEELTVDVGGGNFVKKSIPETQNLIDGQLEKLKSIREELENELNKINQELTKVMVEAQGKKD
jgi:prefoldin alpha subunit